MSFIIDAIPGATSVAEGPNGTYFAVVNGEERQVTPAEIAAAQALADAVVAEEAQVNADKQTIKQQYQAAVTRLTEIINGTFANNTQRDQAIDDIATYLRALIKALKRTF